MKFGYIVADRFDDCDDYVSAYLAAREEVLGLPPENKRKLKENWVETKGEAKQIASHLRRQFPKARLFVQIVPIGEEPLLF